MKPAQRIYISTSKDDWRRACDAGYFETPSLQSEGFIHASGSRQIGWVLRKFFSGRQDLVLLEIDPPKLESKLVYEVSEKKMAPFPHIYGPLNLSAVLSVMPTRVNDQGEFSISWENDGYVVTTDRERINMDDLHLALSKSYWCEEIPREIVERAISQSLCFSILKNDRLAGFGRMITDRATYGYLCDVFVLEAHRGKGLSKWLMDCIKRYPELQDFRRWSLATRDAHGLYEKFGFAKLKSPERYMEIVNPQIYKS